MWLRSHFYAFSCIFFWLTCHTRHIPYNRRLRIVPHPPPGGRIGYRVAVGNKINKQKSSTVQIERCCFMIVCPSGDFLLWVKIWVKCVVLKWVSQTGSFYRRIWAYDSFKTTSGSIFPLLRDPGFEGVFQLRFWTPSPVQLHILFLPLSRPLTSNMGQKYGSGGFLSLGLGSSPLSGVSWL